MCPPSGWGRAARSCDGWEARSTSESTRASATRSTTTTPAAPAAANGGNYSHFCDPNIDARIGRALALQTTDPNRANQLWAQIDRAIVDQAPVVPLITHRQMEFVSNRVGNYQYNPQWGILLDQLWVR